MNYPRGKKEKGLYDTFIWLSATYTYLGEMNCSSADVLILTQVNSQSLWSHSCIQTFVSAQMQRSKQSWRALATFSQALGVVSNNKTSLQSFQPKTLFARRYHAVTPW